MEFPNFSRRVRTPIKARSHRFQECLKYLTVKNATEHNFRNGIVVEILASELISVEKLGQGEQVLQ